MPERCSVGAPLHYLNSTPQIGHPTTTITADILGRNRRRLGAEAFYPTAVDAQAAGVARVAVGEVLPPQESPDRAAVVLRERPERLSAANDPVRRTGDETHRVSSGSSDSGSTTKGTCANTASRPRHRRPRGP